MSAALKNQGIEETYIGLLDDIYEECKGRIILHKLREKFLIQMRLRLGGAISPKLLAACPEGVIRKLDWENAGLRMNEENSSEVCRQHNLTQRIGRTTAKND